MTQLNWWKIMALGITIWLVPFVVSLLFYNPAGELTTDIVAFKTVMLLVSQATGALVIWYFFRSVKTQFVSTGLLVGLAWLVINWLLDILVLVGLFGQPFPQYFIQTGARYLAIPITTLLVGLVAGQVYSQCQINTPTS